MDQKIRELLETEQYASLDSLIEDVAAAASVWPDSVRARMGTSRRKEAFAMTDLCGSLDTGTFLVGGGVGFLAGGMLALLWRR